MSQPDNEILKQLLEVSQQLNTAIRQNNERDGVRKPYFTEKWALIAGDLMRHVYTTGEPRLIPEGDYTAQTIRNQWYQAKEYLLKFLDKSGEYKKMDEVVAAEYIRKRGLMISPRKRKGILQNVAVVPWRPQLEEFMETAVNMQLFERIGVGLTEEDAKYVNELLSPLEDMFVWHCDIKHDHLKVVRVDKAELEEDDNQ